MKVFWCWHWVKQGYPLSPRLFSILINDLATSTQLGIGIGIDDKTISNLLFADDIAVLASSAKVLQLMLDAFHLCWQKCRMVLIRGKTKVIQFMRSPRFPIQRIWLIRFGLNTYPTQPVKMPAVFSKLKLYGGPLIVYYSTTSPLLAYLWLQKLQIPT